jgi:UDP-N-acetylmuramoyl-L-alanyl-D-glutamate--2,6-diaminopimelate ligase
MTSNSQKIEQGDIFLAFPGAKTHGGAFLPSAVERGARAVLTDNAGRDLSSRHDPAIPLLVVPNPRSQAGYLASWFHNSPSSDLYLAGITGTNGKTTTTFLLNQIWQLAHFDSGLIGTVGIAIGSEHYAAQHTTAEADALQNILSVMHERHMRAVAMEVSSHALALHRVDGTHFKTVGFTNLTQDHLDFHKTMEDYYQAKRELFKAEFADHAFINIDNEYGKRLNEEVSIPSSLLSRTGKKAHWYYQSITPQGRGFQVSIRGEGGVLIEGLTHLKGEHNLDNLLLAVAMAIHSGVDPLVIGNGLLRLTGAPGRLESVECGQDFIALVDYAHTPDAVEKVLSSLRNPTIKRVIGVLGCGGDRDASKRPSMGRALHEGCDIAIFTSDNPRSEDPEAILKDMTSGIPLDVNARVISDRRVAIAHAVSLARSGDVIIVLGKGHETGQEINGEKFPFSDQEELRRAIEGKS